MKHNELKEGLADLAQRVEQDHEVQMARSDLYKAAKYSIKLHDMLKKVSEQEGLEGWVAAKITKASDYLSSVYHYMEYELMSESKKVCADCGKPTYETLDEAEKQKGVDGKVCWKGYKRMGTKMKGGKRVDNCVPIKKK